MSFLYWLKITVVHPFFLWLSQPSTYVKFTKALFIGFLLIAALAYYKYGTSQENLV